VHGLRQTYHRLENCFGCIGWCAWVTRLKWKLISVRLETVLVSMQDRCTVCVKRTIGSETVLDTPDVVHLSDEAQMEARFDSFRDSANLDSR
jgi:hypothetical protein